MSSVECLRNFVSERLTAAAEEILGVFIETIVEYEGEIDRQRRLLDVVLKPEIKLHRIELPQQRVFTEEEEVLSDQQLCDQERKSSLDQEDPEPPQVKEEHEELCTSQEGEQLVVKLETDTFMLTPAYQESDHSEPESKSDCQLLFDNWHVTESQDQKGGMYGDSRPATTTQPEPKKSHPKSRSQSIAVSKSNLSEIDHYMHTELPQQRDCMEKEEEEEEAPSDQQLCIQERIFSRDQEDSKPPQIKQEHEGLCTSLEEQQLILKIPIDNFVLTPTYEESNHNEPDSESDRQLLSETRHVAESQDQKVGSQSIINTEPEPEKSHPKSRSQSIDASKSNLSQIDNNMHTNEKKQYSCQACGKVFKFKSRLYMHMKTHTGERPYSCTTCGQGFSFSSSLIVHMRIHTGEKPFICKTCGKAFARRAQVTVHMRRAHTGEKPYVCQICGMRYFEKSVLTRHSLIHEN